MPICDKHKFIFIHIPKTGGTTINRIFKLEKFFDLNPYGALQHLSCEKLKEQVSPTIYNSYFKFCFVRNPFDRLVSEYHWNIWIGRKTFKEFINYVKDIVENKKYYLVPYGEHLIPQVVYIKDVDQIFRFESYSEDIKKLLNKYEIQVEHIPHATKTNHEDYRTYYDDEIRKIVEEIYFEDLKQLNYEF